MPPFTLGVGGDRGRGPSPVAWRARRPAPPLGTAAAAGRLREAAGCARELPAPRGLAMAYAGGQM
eukprot:6632936-Alexandrium_andersonii.AAC.1